ncbi:MAG: metallophosphoesterase, partial [Dehalococcoidales bacterium]|nr:metallophosphoesterase [Dehalococcoidales bacterium]
FLLRDLKPSTEYWYRINSGAKKNFTTPNLESGVLSFAAGGDAHFGSESSRNEITREILKNIAKPENHINFFFSLGDLVEYGFRKEQWIEALNSFSAVSSIPISFAAGNHDAMFDGIKNFTRYCLPDEPHSINQPWYRIDAGKAHFLILDIEWSAETFSAEQQNWLEDQLKNIPADDWKIVIGHGFYYASGSVVDGWRWYDNPETITRLSPIFEKYRVNLVFSGHNHQLELLHRNGVNYIICGGMGGVLDPEKSYQSPASLWYASQKYGFVTVELFQDQAKVTFRNPDYTAIQDFSISLDGQTPTIGK